MNHQEIREIIDFVNKKYSENVPRPVRFVVRKKAKMIEKFDIDEMPKSLKNCTVNSIFPLLRMH